MFDRRLAWFAIGGFALAGTIVSEGCSGADENNSTAGSGICGNGITEAGEACDDGNTNDSDGCKADCTSSTCGDGTVQEENGEGCDDGDSVNDNACDNNCQPNSEFCGNGKVEQGEDCDDGNTVTDDECTNACTDPRCGDGIVQRGEDCDDGNSELGDDCPPDCMGGGAGGNPCNGQAIFSGIVTNDTTPTQAGSGIGSVWSYSGEVGIKAGDEMCAAIGADHVCSFAEVVAAETAGELTAAVPDGQEFWIHRISMDVPRLSEAGVMSPPGPGGRCNEWAYPTNHISDSEFGYYDASGSLTPPAAAQQFGRIWAVTDDDTGYQPELDSGSAMGNATTDGSGVVGGDHECPGGLNSIGGNAVAGCGGECGSATPKAILCCFPVCE